MDFFKKVSRDQVRKDFVCHAKAVRVVSREFPYMMRFALGEIICRGRGQSCCLVQSRVGRP